VREVVAPSCGKRTRDAVRGRSAIPQMEVTIAKAWVGMDISKGSHWEIVLDTEGEILPGSPHETGPRRTRARRRVAHRTMIRTQIKRFVLRCATVLCLR
jgi:hypothetical protein